MKKHSSNVSNSGKAMTSPERAGVEDFLGTARSEATELYESLVCALITGCRFPEGWSVEGEGNERSFEYAMKVRTGSPEFLMLRRFVKRELDTAYALYNGIRQLAEKLKGKATVEKKAA